jgi:hypothetical protein
MSVTVFLSQSLESLIHLETNICKTDVKNLYEIAASSGNLSYSENINFLIVKSESDGSVTMVAEGIITKEFLNEQKINSIKKH